MAQEVNTERGAEAKRRFELGQAASRQEAGTATETDLANLTFAESVGTQVSPIATGENIAPEQGTDITMTGTTPPPGSTPEAIKTKTEAIDKGIADFKEQEAQAKADAATAQSELDRLDIELEGEEGVLEEKAKELFADAGIAEKRKELSDVRAQMLALEERLQLSLAQLENQAIPMNFILGQQALLQRQTLAKSQYLSSKAALIQGQLNAAKEDLRFYFDAAREDHQIRISNLQKLMDYAREDVLRLSADEKDAAERQIELELLKEDRVNKEKDRIIDLMTDNPELWSKSNISLDMPLEDIINELGKTAETIRGDALTTDTVADMIRKYPDAPILPTDTLEEARAKLSQSKIYQQATRLAGGGSSGKAGVQGSYSTQVKKIATELAQERDAGLLTDAGYDYAVSRLVDELYGDLDREEAEKVFSQVSSDINKAMEGTFGVPDITIDDLDDNVGSDITLMPSDIDLRIPRPVAEGTGNVIKRTLFGRLPDIKFGIKD